MPSPTLLADRFLHERADQRVLAPCVIDKERSRLRQAKRFVLTEEATLRYARVARDMTDLLIREQHFARAPFELCWFEFPFPPFVESESQLGQLAR